MVLRIRRHLLNNLRKYQVTNRADNMHRHSYHREALTPVSESKYVADCCAAPSPSFLACPPLAYALVPTTWGGTVLTRWNRTSQQPASHSAINPPLRSPLDGYHHPPLPSQIISSRRRAATTTTISREDRGSTSSGLGISLDHSNFASAQSHQPQHSPHDYYSSHHNSSPLSPRSFEEERSPENMAAHYHPYQSAMATSPVSAQYLSPDYFHYGQGATRRRSNSNDLRAPSPTSSKRLSDSHLRPTSRGQYPYSRSGSPLYGGYSPDLRHGSVSPAFSNYDDSNQFMLPSNTTSHFVDDFASYNAGLLCSQCSYQALTPDALQKHITKHLKVHHCRFSNCPRTEGFATPNDRERHEKSVHKIPGQYWKCMDSQCSSYGKEFSRRDNLKDHLRRMHPIPDGMSESDANVWRSRLADQWRFEKLPGESSSAERRVSHHLEPSSYGGPSASYYHTH